MAVIHIKKKEVQIKIVYVGPGRGGKTTNLEYIFSKIRHRILSDMVSIKTHGDRTLFFDFLPFDLGQIQGYRIKTQLYTVPGQVKYNATRKLVLKGVDGIVFVAEGILFLYAAALAARVARPVPSRSNKTTDRPCLARSVAAVAPAGPPPTTTTSTE